MADDKSAEDRLAAALTELGETGCFEAPGCQLASVPPLLRSEALKLKEIDLCGNELAALPPELLPAGQQLKRLSLARNRLASVPDGLAESQCKKLYLQHNRLSAPPPLPKNLQLVDLSDNALSGAVTLPLDDGQPMLQAVKVARNQINRLRVDAGPTLGTLDASQNGLRVLPEGSAMGTSLKKLNLSGNGLPLLAPSLTRCVNLLELDLSANRLCALPLDLSPLGSLKALHLQRNRLAALPRSVWLPSLLELNVSRNALLEMPRPRASTVPLVELTAARNALRELPAPLLSSLPALTRLDVSSNRLRELDVGGLRALRRLAAACNPLGDWPSGLSALPALQALSLRGCCSVGDGGGAAAEAAVPALPLPPLPPKLLEMEVGCCYDLEGGAIAATAPAEGGTRTLRALATPVACGGQRVRVAVAEMCGRRRGMEDRAAALVAAGGVIVGVFDGHGGDEASRLAADRLPAAVAAALSPPPAPATAADAGAAAADDDDDDAGASLNVSAQLRAAFGELAAAMGGDDFCYVGTTATVAVVRPGVLLVANLGDSAALLVRGELGEGGEDGEGGGGGEARCEWLSELHRPSERAEEERICAAGGVVSEDGELNGMIGVSRALGDTALPPPHCHEPAVRALPLPAADGGGGEPATLVLASDGLWDVVEREEEVIQLLREAGGAAEDQAAALRDEAFHRGSADNITVAVIHLHC